MIDTFDITSAETQLILGIGVAIGVLLTLLFSFRAQVRQVVRRELDLGRNRESRLLEVTTAISQELQLEPLLQLIMETVTEILDADRSTLFLFDAKNGELWSSIAQGLESKEIRFPAHMGLAGRCFSSGETINIPDAYADDRFNPSFDKKTGYVTKSILCFPVRTKQDAVIGVIQVLNKRGGPFDDTDAQRLAAFCAQASVAIQNAQLFEETLTIKNYSEAILESMTEGVLTFDASMVVTRANRAAYRILGLEEAPPAPAAQQQTDDPLVDRQTEQLFVGRDAWVHSAIKRVVRSGEADETLDTELSGGPAGLSTSVNLGVRPLTDGKGARIGGLLVLEDISAEKRVRATMARYVPKEVADRLMEEGGDALGGTLQESTVLFSDIRQFTSFAERAGPQETVGMLNEYFSVMADIVMNEGGILDKYIGDAIMAVFGAPIAGDKDADHALRAAIDMLTGLRAFNARRVSEDKEPINIGIGINTDQVLCGNIGSSKRMDYTVIGDGVNVAARLESANKTYGTQLLVSEYTVAKLIDSFNLREIDRIRVKGKQAPVAIFEPFAAWGSAAGDELTEAFERSRAGIAAYRSRDWSAAMSQFDAALQLRDDSVSKIYKQRCAHFMQTPPATDWDGVWMLQTK